MNKKQKQKKKQKKNSQVRVRDNFCNSTQNTNNEFKW